MTNNFSRASTTMSTAQE
jgi:Ion transport protein